MELPPFTGDALEPARTGGDLAIQACANDPQVAVHAVRNLIRMGMGLVAVRWSQLGFGRTSSTSTTQATPRNLMGFKDGTNNLKAEDTAASRRARLGSAGDVSGASAWMAGGSYLVARRIRMHIEVWDRTPLREQEDIFGRTKRTGAAYGQTGEFDAADFERQRTAGGPLIPATAHIRLASAHQLGGVRSCAAATTTPTGPTASGTSTPACSSSRSCATRASSSCRCSAASPPGRPQRVHRAHRVGVFACPPG